MKSTIKKGRYAIPALTNSELGKLTYQGEVTLVGSFFTQACIRPCNNYIGAQFGLVAIVYAIPAIKG